MKVSVCVGDYAKSPYILKGLGVRVFCMEELCYVLKENAFLLDAELMSDALLNWIRQECNLPELARELYPMMRQGSLSAFVTMLMEYVGFYGIWDIRQAEQTLKKGAGLNMFEKYKARTDNLVQKKKYVTALAEYEQLLQKWDSKEETTEGTGSRNVELKARLLHNKGVVLTRLMMYREAADCFHAAFEADKSQESYRAYLAAKRMELEEGDYIEFVARLEDSLDASLEVERTIEQLNKDWQLEVDDAILKQRIQWRECGEKQKYYDENERLTQALKGSYRSCVGE